MAVGIHSDHENIKLGDLAECFQVSPDCVQPGDPDIQLVQQIRSRCMDLAIHVAIVVGRRLLQPALWWQEEVSDCKMAVGIHSDPEHMKVGALTDTFYVSPDCVQPVNPDIDRLRVQGSNKGSSGKQGMLSCRFFEFT